MAATRRRRRSLKGKQIERDRGNGGPKYSSKPYFSPSSKTLVPVANTPQMQETNPRRACTGSVHPSNVHSCSSLKPLGISALPVCETTPHVRSFWQSACATTNSRDDDVSRLTEQPQSRKRQRHCERQRQRQREQKKRGEGKKRSDTCDKFVGVGFHCGQHNETREANSRTGAAAGGV